MISPAKRRKVLEIWDHRCGICGGDLRGQPVAPARPPVPPKSVTIDHILPLSKGGKSDLANLRPAHYRCNTRRGNDDQTALYPNRKARVAAARMRKRARKEAARIALREDVL